VSTAKCKHVKQTFKKRFAVKSFFFYSVLKETKAENYTGVGILTNFPFAPDQIVEWLLKKL